jgi:hypothetical protein
LKALAAAVDLVQEVAAPAVGGDLHYAR